LVNPWGLVASPIGPFWISDNMAGGSSLVDGTGQPSGDGAPAFVSIWPPAEDWVDPNGEPTGTVFNNGNGFAITENGITAPSQFLFATQEGTIAGWNPTVDPSQAITAVDNFTGPGDGPGANYTGLALANNAGNRFLFAANFRSGTIDVFDQSFQPVNTHGGFVDPAIPTGYSPFNIQNLNGNLVVTYARQDSAHYAPVPGAGSGFVDVFRSDGTLLSRFASMGSLNAPWGLALAPAHFGNFSNDLLVGNFGDGRINAFDPTTGAWMGSLTDPAGHAIAVDGLWGLTFGNNNGAGDSNTLYFSAGIQNSQHGVFGMLQTPASVGQVTQHLTNLTVYKTGVAPSNSENGVDNYPIPPSAGPSLQGGTVTQPALLPALLSPSASTSLTAAGIGSATGNELPGSGNAISAAASMDQAAFSNRPSALSMLLDLGGSSSRGEKGTTASLDVVGTPVSYNTSAKGSKGQVLMVDSSSLIRDEAFTEAPNPDFLVLDQESDSSDGAIFEIRSEIALPPNTYPGSVADALAAEGVGSEAPAERVPVKLVAMARSAAGDAKPEPPVVAAAAPSATNEGPVGHDWTQAFWVFLLGVGLRVVWGLGFIAGEEGRAPPPLVPGQPGRPGRNT
jgi:uncharacterized protein (TIGR03118 family)